VDHDTGVGDASEQPAPVPGISALCTLARLMRGAGTTMPVRAFLVLVASQLACGEQTPAATTTDAPPAEVSDAPTKGPEAGSPESPLPAPPDGGPPAIPDAQAADTPVIATGPECTTMPAFERPGGACGGAPTYAGRLCGPPDRPCRILRDETTSAIPTDLASLSLDEQAQPHLLARDAYGRGYYFRRAASGWSVENTPFQLASGSLVAMPGGPVLALVSSFDKRTTLWARHPCGWTSVDRIDGWFPLGQMAVTKGGCLHSALWGEGAGIEGRLAVTQRDRSWTTTPVSEKSWLFYGEVLALSPGGAAQVAYYDEAESTKVSTLHWLAPPMAEERVFDHPRGWAPITPLMTVTSGADGTGQPHIVASLADPPSNTRRIIYTTRAGNGWSTRTLAEGSASPSYGTTDRCLPGRGNLCKYDYVAISPPLAVVAGGDTEVRVLFTRAHTSGDLHWDCPDSYSLSSCMQFGKWAGTRSVSGQLIISWLEGSGSAEAVLVDDLVADQAITMADAMGNLHVVVPNRVPGKFLRYLMLGL
jgi:hypothetical protein